MPFAETHMDKILQLGRPLTREDFARSNYHPATRDGQPQLSIRSRSPSPSDSEMVCDACDGEDSSISFRLARRPPKRGSLEVDHTPGIDSG